MSERVLLTAVLTHLRPAAVRRQLGYLRELCPASQFVACHGGRRSDFEALAPGTAIFSPDPTLRGPHFDQSMNATLRALYEHRVRDDPRVDLVYLIEYDHLILDPGFETALRGVAEATGAGLVAKAASRRNDSNWPHYLRTRGDRRLAGYVEGVSCRGDPEARWGCLGTGMLFRREALEAFCRLPAPPAYYFELFVPTMVYHLGHEVVDFDAVGDLYRAVRWLPELTVGEVLEARRRGLAFAHPFKRVELLEEIAAASGSGPKLSVAARSE